MTAGISIPVLKEALRRAVLTLASVPDPDLRHRLGPRTAWPEFVRHTRDAYGSAPPKVRAFQPTPEDLSRYLDCLSMLAWYGRRSEKHADTARLFRAWAFGAAMWELQVRMETNRRRPASPSAVKKRLNGMVISIAEAFPEDVFRISLDEVPEVGHFPGKSGDGGGMPASDARDLPNSPQFHREPPEPPQTNGERVKSRKALTKHLERNKSRALERENKRQRASN